MDRKRNYFFSALTTYLTVFTKPALAHASEQGLVLLLPTVAYATAGTLVVIASILLAICVPKRFLLKLFYDTSLGGHFSSFDLSFFTSIFASIALFLLIYIGFQGPTDPQNNLLPLSIWTVWWIGLFVIQGTVMDLWRWVNPWSGIMHLLNVGRVPIVEIPDKWAAWPAVVVFTFFQMFMLADIAPNDPQRLALLVSIYWTFTLIGISVCGQIA